MNKLIVAVIAVASAIAVNAANVKWSANMGVVSPSPDGSAYAAQGWASYYTMLVFTSDQATAVDTAIKAGNFTSLSTLAVSSNQAQIPGAFSGTVTGLTGSSVTLFGVIFDTYSATETIADAGYYYVTGNVTQDTYDPSGNATATTAMFTSTQMTGEWKAVPEPTSGLLLILGMAGLALRRRRA